MRDAVSQPSLDIEESYFSKNTLFLFKNDFLFYYLKLYIPPVPLIWVFEAFFGPPFCSLTKGKEEKDGSSKVGSRGKSGSVCLAAALIWMINSHLNRTALYFVTVWQCFLVNHRNITLFGGGSNNSCSLSRVWSAVDRHYFWKTSIIDVLGYIIHQMILFESCTISTKVAW